MLEVPIEISGTYKLIKRDNNFGDYLESLGMSKSTATHLKDIEEKLTIIEETPTNPNWTMILSTRECILSVSALNFNYSYH